MSLIQEALKRQQEEEDTKAAAAPISPIPNMVVKPKLEMTALRPAPTVPPTLLASPSIPPPLPVQSPLPALTVQSPLPGTLPKTQLTETPLSEAAQDVAPAQRKALSTLAVIIVVIILLLAAGISMIYFALMKMKHGTEKKTVEVLKPAITQIVAVATQTVPKTVSSVAQTTNQSVAKPSVTQQVAVVVATNAPPVIVRPPPPKPAIEWPSLKLTAIAGKGVKGAARINGQVVMVGESVEDVTLIEINEQNVVLVFKGETNTLRIGTTTR